MLSVTKKEKVENIKKEKNQLFRKNKLFLIKYQVRKRENRIKSIFILYILSE